MKKTTCCEPAMMFEADAEHEIIMIEKAKGSCKLCEDYAERQSDKPVAVICCEGACLRGEVARQAANILCHELAPEKTVRICLGGAFTKNTGQRGLVRDAGRVLALEGCPVYCASRMMAGTIPGLQTEVINVSKLYEFDRSLFGIEEMPADEIRAHGRSVAEKMISLL
ncbi:MAG: putative zinc-binding protein [Geobacteraceae bacterium]|nr:putative zinc-binding protein [Geobacteraceae bacterium]